MDVSSLLSGLVTVLRNAYQWVIAQVLAGARHILVYFLNFLPDHTPIDWPDFGLLWQVWYFMALIDRIVPVMYLWGCFLLLFNFWLACHVYRFYRALIKLILRR